MQSKKQTNVLSAIAMAAVAGLGAQYASAATLSSYYANGIISSADPATSAITLGVNATEVDLSAASPTVTIPAGDYFSYGVAAVLTSNVNGDSGKKTNNGKVGQTILQPTNLGLADVGYRVLSVSANDATAALLAPDINAGARPATPGEFNTTAQVGGGGVATSGFGSSYGANPSFNFANSDPGDAEAGVGVVGTTFQIFEGNASADGKSASDQVLLTEFNPNTGAAVSSPNNATLAFDTLAYQAVKAGTVTLLPAADPTATQYWKLATAGTASTASIYAASYFSASDTINALPVLTVVITPAVSASHPILNLEASADATYAPTITTLTVTGNHGKYSVVQTTGINTATGTVEAKGFNPGTDEELYGLQVLVNGTQATKAQLDTLVTEINSVGGGLPAGLTVADSIAAPDPFPSIYGLFATATGAITGTGDNFLGFDLSNSNDANLAGYTVNAVAVVPEPMSLGVLALGGISLLARRRRNA